MNHKFFPQQQRASLGQSTSADCPDFSLEAEATQFYRPQRFSGSLDRECYGVVALRILYAVAALVLLGIGLAGLDRFAFLYFKK
ncbi:MAG TPA: hypothetical protein VGQ12_07385 [Candidatus Angelobacter sp.]|jgi:hypothetical protein|nr:hypothetical protein [Candidatus Angelobacter sp.]